MKLNFKGLLAFSTTLIAGLMFVGSTATAATYTFSGSRIIDDRVYDNTGSMDANHIDSFLNQFAASCISPNNHFQAPDPTGYSPGGGYTYGGNVSAGRVIYDAAQAYGLNPQVILTTLQKEQTLVTGGSGCSVLRYTGAMGYGCPDGGTTHDYSGVNLYTLNGTNVTSVTGTCVNSAAKSGFSQQVIHGAWLLKFGEQRSEGNINWNVQKTNSPVPGDVWDNSDDPQTCYGGPMTQGTFQVCPSGATNYYDGYITIDSTATHMDSGSTAALYWYTPHFSGNQNFFNIFTGWFGGSTVAGYAWITTGYTITSLDRSVTYDPGRLMPGQTYLATLEAYNYGNQTWMNSGPTPVMLGKSGGNSMFCNSTWLACNRPAHLLEASVAPGQDGHFEFQFQAPYTLGQYRDTFEPLAEELTWFNINSPADQFGITVVSPGSYAWWPRGYSVNSLDGNIRYDPGKLQPGQTYQATLTALNVGTATWLNSGATPVTLGTLTSGSTFCNNTWVACNRPAYLQEASVAPGQDGHFIFHFQTPYTVGQYRETFRPVAEMFTWFGGAPPGDIFGIWAASPGTYTWSMGGYKIFDQTGTNRLDPGQLQHGQTYLATVDATNTGTATWLNTGPIPVTLAASNPTSRTSSLCTNTWEACNRPAVLTDASVAPGQTGHFRFLFQAPASPGIYSESFKPVAEFFSWFNDDSNDLFGITVH